jgi:ubiquinone/menaquinone biosynthesis C-methylase UbiE
MAPAAVNFNEMDMMETLNKTDKHAEVSEYYGATLEKSDDLKTNACCTVQSYPPAIQEALGLIHDEVLEKYYGCGLTIPDGLEGKRVLDLGSGSGRDCYLVSRLVGEQGSVVGIDMTDEQLAVACRHIDFHAEQFGYTKPNVEFRKGLIEKLDEAGLESDSFDVTISNCVINLCPDKPAALREIFRVLKPGGRFYFSDVYSDQPVPAHLVDDPVLYGECLSGALAEQDFIRLAIEAGFCEPVEVERSEITIENAEVQDKVGDLKFNSITFNVIKPSELI